MHTNTCTIFVILPGGALIMESTYPVHTFSKYIHYHYSAYMIWCRYIIVIVHVNDDTCTKSNNF